MLPARAGAQMSMIQGGVLTSRLDVAIAALKTLV
jgi:hypothetical protein